MRLAMAAALLLLSGAAHAKQRIDVPVDVGVGPAFLFIGAPQVSPPAGTQRDWYGGPVFDDQPVHFGLRIYVAAVIDRAFIQKHKDRVPKQYRKQADKVNEIRFKPSIFIPDELILSPPYKNTGMYGLTWKPFGLWLPLAESGGGSSIDLGLTPLLTAAFIHSSAFPSPTVFVRPGLELKLETTLALSSSFLVSVGWSSGFYVPQVVGHFLDVTPVDQAIWHVGEAFLMFHVRFPYEVVL